MIRDKLSYGFKHFLLTGGRNCLPDQDGGRARYSALGRLELQDWIIHDRIVKLIYWILEYFCKWIMIRTKLSFKVYTISLNKDSKTKFNLKRTVTKA